VMNSRRFIFHTAFLLPRSDCTDRRIAPSVYRRLNVPQYMLGGMNTQVIPIPPYKLGRMHTCMR
jgi:hypothetical protein